MRQGEAQAGDFKLFRGYCGWSGGQLQTELAQHLWFTTDGPAVASFALAGANDAMTGARNHDEVESEAQGEGSDGLAHAERHWGAALQALGGSTPHWQPSRKSTSAGLTTCGPGTLRGSWRTAS